LSAALVSFQCASDCLGRCVDHRDFIRIGNIDEDAPALRIDVERLGMRCHERSRNQAEAASYHDGDFGGIGRVAAAMADKEQVVGLVIDHVVGIVGELDLSSQSQRRPL
jgi:hypothetical protein